MNNKTIKFYIVSDEYGEFSNFAAYPIKLKKKKWPTSEHYFQAQKFQDKSYQEKIRIEQLKQKNCYTYRFNNLQSLGIFGSEKNTAFNGSRRKTK